MTLLARLRRVAAVTLMLVLPLLAAGCGPTVSGTIDDATITARVKTILLNDPQGALWKLDVATAGGVVTLSGVVASEQERDRAVALARQADGVAEVLSTLQIKPAPAR
jgi:hyperosmotically inducible periplasmic protein